MRPHFAPLAAVMALVLLLSACTGNGTKPRAVPPAETLVQSAATALAALDVTALPLPDATAAQRELVEVTEGLGDVKPQVSVGKLDYGADTATGELRWSWPLFPKPWEYTTTLPLRLVDGAWQIAWTPTIVESHLTNRSRLDATRDVPDRARILGNNGVPIVEMKEVVRLGLDKTRLTTPAELESSARALATLAGIDPDTYVQTVKAAGPKAFVLARIDRGATPPSSLGDIPGALARHDQMMLTPYKSFGGPLIGVMGEPTAEIIAKSGGAVQAGDTVGRSGLQAWHDAQLRGVPGLKVSLVLRDTAPAAPAGAPSEVLPATLFTVDKVPGKDLHTTLDVDLQTKLEGVLRTQPVKTAAAVVQPSTGKVLALASSENAAAEPMANWGHYPPGSTFKVATSLAMIRGGLNPDSPVECPTTITVDGRRIQNYPEYPAEHNGTIPLKDALAFSCNTAFVGGLGKLDDAALAQAAGSLGLGTDYDAGFPSFFGEVPAPTSATGKAEQSFGQGTVLASPMAIAGMSASVAAKRTVVPWLVEPGPLAPTTAPLTEAEGTQLQTMMRQVVDIGSAKVLQGYLVGAKTGTAEFGPADNIQTHVWMTGYTANDLAITVYGDTGHYGTDLAPLIKAALS